MVTMTGGVTVIVAFCAVVLVAAFMTGGVAVMVALVTGTVAVLSAVTVVTLTVFLEDFSWTETSTLDDWEQSLKITETNSFSILNLLIRLFPTMLAVIQLIIVLQTVEGLHFPVFEAAG